jgi:hypothetical protein
MKRLLRMALIVLFVFGVLASFYWARNAAFEQHVVAQTAPTPTPVPAAFDQAAAIAKLRQQIKGKENDLAPTVFKNIQTMKNTPAGRLLSVMEMGFARSLGVNCTHCHVPDKWEAEDKTQKQTARDMSAMVSTINRELLRNIKNLKSESPIVNCTTCHRGEVKPALNLPAK